MRIKAKVVEDIEEKSIIIYVGHFMAFSFLSTEQSNILTDQILKGTSISICYVWQYRQIFNLVIF
jgi:hypothetical protein